MHDKEWHKNKLIYHSIVKKDYLCCGGKDMYFNNKYICNYYVIAHYY